MLPISFFVLAYQDTLGAIVEPILKAFFRTKVGQRIERWAVAELCHIDPEAPVREAMAKLAKYR